MRRRGIPPARFRWIDWNRDKILAHDLTTDEVEFAWRRGFGMTRRRRDGTSVTKGPTPGGRMIRIVWCWNEVFDALAFGATSRTVFVITAHGED